MECCPFQLSIDPSFIATSLHPQPLRGAPISIIKCPFLSVCKKALLVSSLVTVEYPRLNLISFYSRKVGTQDLLTQNYSVYYDSERTTYTFCDPSFQLRRSCSDSISDQPDYSHSGMTLDFTSPSQQTSAKSSPKYFQTLAQ